MITTHKWRPPHSALSKRGFGPRPDRPCEYMNCRRPKAEHAEAVRLRDGVAR